MELVLSLGSKRIQAGMSCYFLFAQVYVLVPETENQTFTSVIQLCASVPRAGIDAH